MRTIIPMCIFLLISVSLWGIDNSGTINGKVLDASSKETIPYATIVIKKDNQILTGGITDDKGDFEINNLPWGNYTVDIQFIGYVTNSQNVTLSNKSYSLGTIYLKEDTATQLQEVEVIAERSSIEQKIDRKVVHIGRDLSTVGATASDVLGNIPSLYVDQDGNLSLRGNSNVRVLLDGRPSNMDVAQLLKQIPSSSIKSVELITNPSAKYNPEGMSGIINIILHKNTMDGFNGNLSSTSTLADTPKYNNNLNLNLRKGKLNLFGNVGHNEGNHANQGNIYTDEDSARQFFDIDNLSKNIYYKVGFDIYFNDKNTLSLYTNQSFNDFDSDVRTELTFPIASQNIYQNDEYFSKNTNRMYNVAYKKLFKKPGETLDFEITLNNNDSYQDGYFQPENSSINNFEDFTQSKESSIVGNIDYSNPINENSNIELGLEYRGTATDNDYQTTRLNIEDAGFEYDFHIYSLYGTWGQKFNKFSYQIGARLEQYNVEANYFTTTQQASFTNDYFTLYPSAYANYTPNETSSWNLSMSRRVDRPSIQQTRPIRNFATPRVTSIGNPELLPQFTNSIELNYTKMIGRNSITAGIFLRDINDQIAQSYFADESADPEDKKMIMSYTNFDKNTAYGFDISANLKPTKWWDIQPGADFSAITEKGYVSKFNPAENAYEFIMTEIETSRFNARLNNNFRVTKQIQFNLFGFYRGGVKGIQNNSHEMYKIDIGGRYTFLDNKAILSLRFNDVFDTMKFGFDSLNPFPGHGQFTWESQSVVLNFNYYFGTGKSKAMQRKHREDNTSKASGGMF